MNQSSLWKESQVLVVVTTLVLATGCVEAPPHTGSSAENDQNVLSGGPVTGTRVGDLPAPVKETLKTQRPSAEVADIYKQRKDGRIVYKISFLDANKDPTLYIEKDGSVVEKSSLRESNPTNSVSTPVK